MSAPRPDVETIIRTLGPRETSVWVTDFVSGQAQRLIATNGHFLIGIPSDRVDMVLLTFNPEEFGVPRPELLTPQRRAAGERYLSEWPIEETGAHRTDDAEELAAWAREGVLKTCACCGTGFDTCWRCKGTKAAECACPCGKATHGTPCKGCEELGLVRCTRCGLGTQRAGQLMGELIDRSILARLLFLMPHGVVSLFVDRERRRFCLEVDGVRGVVAFMWDLDAERYASAPVWPPAIAPAGEKGKG